MTRFWVCIAGAGFFLALLVLHSRFCASRLPPHLHLAFKISWRAEEILYRLDVDWPKYSEYFTGATFCVAVDSLNGLVYVAQRGDNIPKVLVFTEDGYFLRSWNYTVDTPHGIFAASTPQEKSVWITDVGSGFYGHTIKKYNSFGDLVQVLGTPGKKGTGLNPLQFDNPAELHVDDTGDIYIVDGDGGLNNRLIKLSQDFMILWLRGENGTGPAKFNIPHSVTVDSTGRVWVADRGNKRLQVFDKDTGDWLGEWKNCFSEEGPSAVRFTPDGKYVVVAQLNLSRLLILVAPPVGNIGDCSVVSTIQLADQVSPHLLDVSRETGAVYVAEIGAKQVQKYIPVNRIDWIANIKTGNSGFFAPQTQESKSKSKSFIESQNKPSLFNRNIQNNAQMKTLSVFEYDFESPSVAISILIRLLSLKMITLLSPKRAPWPSALSCASSGPGPAPNNFHEITGVDLILTNLSTRFCCTDWERRIQIPVAFIYICEDSYVLHFLTNLRFRLYIMEFFIFQVM
ncbi:hypothetical protein MG293_011009 [Ovis ammon polii]|uniref:NHL repeat-containing protein 3 n=1 Tax=Ovis ammon polii TaxID=230172 RepID=A0AAD4U2Q3_OVIAM|nr:hypothetical protein MG293_011009 [Ovis ammon polii]